MMKIKLYIAYLLVCGSISTHSEAKPAKPKDGSNEGIFSGLKLRNIGPALMSGRISDIQIHPRKQSTWYVAVGSGGVWKTENAGTTWTPIFDKYASYSIGCVCLDPANPDIVWVGTGENVSGRHVGFGDGIYKSLDGGKSFKNMGLEKSEHIAKIVVDPRNSDVVFVAAEGPLWSPGGERGLYKTTDGGKSWKPSLEISPDTGVTDVALDPVNPDIIYAAAYQRRRSVAAFMGGGPQSGIYKSIDGGASWRKIKSGLPDVDLGKIALAVSPQKPQVVYASIETPGKQGGFFRSTDRAESFEKRSDYFSGGTGAHYYQEIFADPHQFDRVYQMDAQSRVTNDGGKSFTHFNWQYRHGDDHALAFDPNDPNYLLVGTDGGLYESWDRGKTYKFVANLPVTQFYRLALDNAKPFYHVHGGTQDNGSQLGPSRNSSAHGIANSDWLITFGADGYACAIDPTNPDTLYVSMQVGGLFRFDRRTLEALPIRPRPVHSSHIPRWNWDAPLLLSPHQSTRLYYGSDRLHQSDDRGDSWRTISPDLTRNLDRYRQPIMGKTWGAYAGWDHLAMSYFSTLTSIAESPLQAGLLYTGSDDGLMHVSEDAGKTWRKIESFPGVPRYTFINDIRCSEHDPDTVFAAFDNHKRGDFTPYLLQSNDRGRSWKSISGNLPKNHLVWGVVQDHINAKLLFAATEFGLFFTLDAGGAWNKLHGAATIAFRDLEIQKRESDLVGASFGRGIYVLDDYTPLRYANPALFQKEAELLPIRKALQYIPRQSLGMNEKATQGHAYYTAENPPYGALLTYFLKDGYKTGKQLRKQQEKDQQKKGATIDFPGWDELRREEQELEPKIFLAIYDTQGNLVRKIPGSTERGFHRIAWDLRYAPWEPVRLKEKKLLPWEQAPAGPMVVPGKFRVSLLLETHGRITTLGRSQTVEVESYGFDSLSEKDQQEKLAYQMRAGRLQRAMLGAHRASKQALSQLRYIRKAFVDTPGATPKMMQACETLRRRILEALAEIEGEPSVRRMSRPTAPGLLRLVSAYQHSTSPLTKTAYENLSVASTRFESLSKKLHRLIDIELSRFKNELEKLHAPWTPGREVPIWNP